MKLEDFKYGKPFTLIASLFITAVGIYSGYEFFKIRFNEYKKENEKRTQAKVIEVVLENDHLLIDKIIEVLDDRYDDGPRIDSLIEIHKLNDSYFAVGFRSNVDGDIHYRDMYGKLYKVYYNYQEYYWFYVNENGEKQIVK